MAERGSPATHRPAPGQALPSGRLRSVRTRTTAAVVVVVGLVAVGGAIALVAALGRSLTDELASVAELRAEEIVRTLESGTDPAQLDLSREEDRFVQVLTPDRAIAAASEGAGGALLADPPAPGQGPVEAAGPPGDGGERYVVVAEQTDGPAGQPALTVLVGQESESVQESIDALTATLQPAVPLVVALVGLATWWLVGRALAPVEAIRRQVEDVSAARLAARIPVPPTGDEVARLATTMNAMLERLEASQERQRRFVSDASHELRSPAAAIRQHAEVSLAHPDSVSTENLAGIVLAEARRLEQLVAHLLLLARSDEGALTPAAHPVDLDDLVLEEATRLRAYGEVATDVTAVSAGRVRGDAALLRRLVSNLLDNAAHHARSTVSVALAETSDHEVRLRVDDDGPGIPPEQRTRVLDRFVRLDEARARGRGGVGLGLSIVQAVVLAHGGRIEVAEAPRGGARIDVHLPAFDG